LNYENSKVVNTALRNMILEEAPPVHVHNPKKIKRQQVRVVVSEPETKEYKVVIKKRRLMEDFDSVPYGYEELTYIFIYLFIHLFIFIYLQVYAAGIQYVCTSTNNSYFVEPALSGLATIGTSHISTEN